MADYIARWDLNKVAVENMQDVLSAAISEKKVMVKSFKLNSEYRDFQYFYHILFAIYSIIEYAKNWNIRKRKQKCSLM